MKHCSYLPLAAVVLAFLPGCTTPTNVRTGTPPRSSYPVLTRTFDTSARLAVYGKSALQIRELSDALKQAGYALVPFVRSSCVGKVSPPDLIVDIIRFECGLSTDYRWVTCGMTVRVRKPMRTEPGAVPTADLGQTFAADAAEAPEGAYVYDATQIPALRYPETEKRLYRQVCANLMNVEAFRLALELK